MKLQRQHEKSLSMRDIWLQHAPRSEVLAARPSPSHAGQPSTAAPTPFAFLNPHNPAHTNPSTSTKREPPPAQRASLPTQPPPPSHRAPPSSIPQGASAFQQHVQHISTAFPEDSIPDVGRSPTSHSCNDTPPTATGPFPSNLGPPPSPWLSRQPFPQPYPPQRHLTPSAAHTDRTPPAAM